MIHLLTATPGGGKSLWATESLLKLSRENVKNLKHNYYYAKAFFEKITELKLDNELRSVMIENGQGLEKEYELVFLDSDYFDYLKEEYTVNIIMNPETDDLQKNFPDYYYERCSILNNIIDRLNKEHNTNFSDFKPVRTMYTNLDKLKLIQCRPLPPDCDWRKTPQGSYYVIDEAQLIPIFADEYRGIDPIVKDLTIHRKLGYDFLFITQFPTMLHKYVRHLTSHHRHLINIFGWEQSMNLEWSTAQDAPNAAKSIARAENLHRWKFPKHVYGLYHSTTINTRTKRYPKKMVIFFILAALLIAAAISILVFKESSPLVQTLTGDTNFLGDKNDKNTTNSNGQNSVNASTKSTEQNKQNEKTNADLLANTAAASDAVPNSDLSSAIQPDYDPANPYAFNPGVTPDVVNYRVFSGCVAYEGNYYAVDQQGTVIDKFSKSDCKKLLDKSYNRPFDYFGNRQKPVPPPPPPEQPHPEQTVLEQTAAASDSEKEDEKQDKEKSV